MATKFENKMRLMAKNYGLHLDWQDIKYGYRRVRFTCETHEKMVSLLKPLNKAQKIWTDFQCNFAGNFEGYVYVMERKDWEAFKQEREKEQKHNEDWWLRYHLADTGTRRLMACGKVE